MKANNKSKPIIWNGKEYPSLEDMSRKLWQSAQGLRYYLKNDKPFQGHFIDYKI